MTLEYVLKQAGLNPEKDNPKANINVRTDVAFAAQAGAFIGGEADYTTLFEPTASQLELEGKGFVLASVGSFTDEVAYTCYSTLKSYMNKNDDKIVKFTNAITEALNWVKTHTAKQIALSIHQYFKETTIEVLESSIQRYKDINAWSETPYLDESEFKHLQDIMISSKEISKYASYKDLIINKYIINKK